MFLPGQGGEKVTPCCFGKVSLCDLENMCNVAIGVDCLACVCWGVVTVHPRLS